MSSDYFFPFPVYGQPERVCKACGMTERELTHTGQVGCAECYQVFGDLLIPYIRRLHGSDQHRGRVPGTPIGVAAGIGEIESLRQKLNEAVAAEEYEKAAVLRDRLRMLEGGVENV